MYKTHHTHKLIYKKFFNKLTKVKALSKHRYFEKEINNNHDNPCKLWELLRFVLPCSNKKASSFPSKLQFYGDKIDIPEAILECFNSYFCNIGARLAKNIDSNNSYYFKKFLRNRISLSLYLEPTQSIEIISQINYLNIHKSVGHDNLPSYFLRTASHILTLALCYYFNYALQLGIFRVSCKIVRVVPIYKNGKNRPGNKLPTYFNLNMLF